MSKHIIAVHDAIVEARIDQGGSPDFAAAMAFIPDEFHAAIGSPEQRFVASVIANANAADRSPYTIALFAFDLA